ncbi:SipD family cell invasion protein [Proteus hauseri ATCC 700826]|uniref:SipD family cell invasion protein n=1 Tax=Proteus hauseri ATCC 700826 TaxID=1354271 RepID=A0AAJ3LSF6_PROHU|nr:IpaD/SipD/SspD family type III secretion system needle tip protein [Proteus hauseri]OAT44953.1 SipD family cell invasion protein [Proteus hauseri ATCC 700826]
MLNSIVNNLNNNVNENKNRLNKKTLDRKSENIFNVEGRYLEQENFNEEIDKAKEQLKYQNNNLNIYHPTDNENSNSLKENAIVNENNYAKNSNNVRVLTEEISLIQNSDDKNNSSSDSLHDFFYEVKNSIVVGKNDYLDTLKDLFSSYMNYVNEVREALSSLSECVKAGSKDGYVEFNLAKFYAKVEGINVKYGNNTSTILMDFKVYFYKQIDNKYRREIHNNSIDYTEDEARNVVSAIKKLFNEIKGISINDWDMDGYDVYLVIKPDISDLTKLLDTLKNVGDVNSTSINLLQTEFDLIKKSIDILEKRVNTNLEELSKKYSAANSNFDNFVKIVSSTMNTLLEMAKGFLRF